MRGQESYILQNAAAGTYKFELKGGRYCIDTLSTGTGTIDLQQQSADGATYNSCGVTQITATAGFQTGIELPPGQYQLVIVTFTANYISVVRIPTD